MKSKLLRAALAAFLLVVTRLSAQSPLEQAAAALQSGDLAAAESQLAPLIAAEPPDAAALSLLSQVRVAQKRSKEAIELSERAVKLAPDRAEFHAQLGMACSARMGEIGFMQQAMMSGRLKKAFERTVELDPRNLTGLIGLGRYYLNAPEIAGGSAVKAKEFALRVRELNPYVGGLELGNVAERGGEFAEALAAYESVVALRPEQGRPHYLCGRALARLGRKDEARARFEQALALDPGLEPAKKALAEIDAPAAG